MALLDGNKYKYKIPGYMQCWFVGKFEFCGYWQPKFRIHCNFAFGPQLKRSWVRGRNSCIGGTTTKQIGMIKCIILPLNLLKVFSVVWNDRMCIFLGSTASCATDNMQFMKYDFARLVATLRQVAVDQCVGKRLYRLRRFAVGRQWLMPFWSLYR